METPESATAAAAPVDTNAANIAKNDITVTILSGTEVEKADYAKVAGRLHPNKGQKLLTEESLEIAQEITGNEKVDPAVRESTQKVVDAHNLALGKVLGEIKPALITILNNPIGAELSDEVKAAYKEVGGNSERLFSHKVQPGLSRDESKHSTILAGISRDAYAVAKATPELADLVEAAEGRQAAAKDRLKEIRANFDEKHTPAQVKLFRTLETMQNYQNNPASVNSAERKALTVSVGEGKDKKDVPIFDKGRLTPAAKDKLNELQKVEGQPEFLVKMIRGVFGKDKQGQEVAKASKDIGL